MSKSKPEYKSPGKAIDPGLPVVPNSSGKKELSLYNTQSDLLGNIYGDIGNMYKEIQAGKGKNYDKVWNPLKTQIDDTYNDLYGGAQGKAGNLGMLDSVGFADYVTKNIANEKAKTLTEAKANLPAAILSPYLSLGQGIDTGLSSLQDRVNAAYANVFNRAQLLNNYKLNQASNFNAYNQGNKGKFLGIF